MDKDKQENEKVLDVHLEIFRTPDGRVSLSLKSPQVPQYKYCGIFTEDATYEGFGRLLKGAVHKFFRVVWFGVK